jgi:hypothetical protein
MNTATNNTKPLTAASIAWALDGASDAARLGRIRLTEGFSKPSVSLVDQSPEGEVYRLTPAGDNVKVELVGLFGRQDTDMGTFPLEEAIRVTFRAIRVVRRSALKLANPPPSKARPHQPGLLHSMSIQC